MPTHRQRIALVLLLGVLPLLACSTLSTALGQPGGTAIPDNSPVGSIVMPPPHVWPHPDGTALGSKTAPVVVQEFADFQCPICKEYASSVEPRLIQDYVATGKIRYEWHSFIVIDGNVGGVESRHAAEASLCANAQERFWDYDSLLYSNQQGEHSGAFRDPRLKAFAVALGLDSAQFNTCFDTHQYASVVDADQALATQKNIAGTPTLLINGVIANNALDYPSLQKQINQALGQQ